MDDAPETLATLQTARTTLRRRAGRGHYDPALVHAIIDEALVCQVGFLVDGVAMSLPTMHVRVGNCVYLHGAFGNHMLKSLLQAATASVTFMLLDGLVFARSAFHHSMNYRSVVVFGEVRDLEALDDKRQALHALIERLAPGRSQETRAPTDAELRTTRVLRLSIDEASAKVRTGPPIDLEADLGHAAWAGVLPLRVTAAAPQRDALLPADAPVSSAVAARGRQLCAPDDPQL